MTYVIEVKPGGTTIERRYSDFDSLRQELIKRYPGYMIPPIPKKKIGKTTEVTFLEKRQDLLQKFLNEVLGHPVLRYSDIVSQFLKVSSKEWESRIKVMAKIPASKNVTEFKTVQGSAKIDISEKYEKYCERLHPLVGMTKDRYKVIKSYSKTIMNDFEKLSNSFSMAGSAYSIMATTTEAMGDATHSEMYSYMGEIHKRLSDAYKGFKEIYMSEFVKFYRYYKYEMGALEEMIGIQRNSLTTMNTLEKKLWSKKEHKFAQKNIATWDLDPNCKVSADKMLNDKILAFQEMFYKETTDSKNSRMLYGYYTNKVVEEMGRVVKKQILKTRAHFEEIPSLFIVKEEELKAIWTEFLDKMKAYNAGKGRLVEKPLAKPEEEKSESKPKK